VFSRSGTTWTQQAYLKAASTDAGDHFGSAIAVHGDTVAVGAPGDDGPQNGSPESGAVFVFTRVNGAWNQQTYLRPATSAPGDYLGESGLSLWEDTLLAGAGSEDGGRGAAYLFRRVGPFWQPAGVLQSAERDVGDYFGQSVSVEGTTVAVGAYGEGSAATGIDGDQTDNSAYRSGAVFIFR